MGAFAKGRLMNKIFEVPLYPYTRSADQDAVTPAHHKVVIVGAGPSGWPPPSTWRSRGSRRWCWTTMTRSVSAAAPSVSPSARWRSRTVWAAARRWWTRACIWNVGKVFFDDRKVYDFNLLPEDGHKRPAFINLQQPYFEEYLVERARELEAEGAPIEIRGGNKVTAVDRSGRPCRAGHRHARRPLHHRRRLADRLRRGGSARCAP